LRKNAELILFLFDEMVFRTTLINYLTTNLL